MTDAHDLRLSLTSIAMKPHPDREGCLSRLRGAPWGELCFGDEPMPLLLLLVLAGVVLPPLMQEAWPLLLSLMILAIPLRAWAWCREQARDAAAGVGQAEREP